MKIRKIKMKNKFKKLVKALKGLNRKKVAAVVGALVVLGVGASLALRPKKEKMFGFIAVDMGTPVVKLLLKDAKQVDGAVCGIDVRNNAKVCVKSSGFLLQEIESEQ